MSSYYKLPMFSKDNYQNWKTRMQSHLAALDDDMWYVITDGLIKITKVVLSTNAAKGTSQVTEKPISEWNVEDKKKNNFDNIAKDFMHKTLDDNMLCKIRTCTTAKEIWDKLAQLY